MEVKRSIAKETYNQGNYEEATKLYRELWDNCICNEIDCWLGWEYAETLKKAGYLDEAIEICKKVYSANKEFKFLNNLLSWCLYEKYIKNINQAKIPEDIQSINKIAEFITKITKQDLYSSYEVTVYKMIKMYKKANNFNEIDKWLNKLDVSLLSDKPYKYVRDGNTTFEGASRKEEWFTMKCKVLLKQKKYSECIELCDRALSEIVDFHYDYDIWLKADKVNCYGMLGKEDKAIKILDELLVTKRHWTLYKLAFNLNRQLKDYNNALLYAYTAALTTDPPKVKVNLYFEIAEVLQSIGNNEYALKHYMLCKKIKEENKGKVSSILKAKINYLKTEIYVDEKIDLLRELKEFWINEKIKFIPRYDGNIKSLFPNGKAGFIQSLNGTYYFTIGSILKDRSKLSISKDVSFSLVDSFDKKKGIKTKEATDILFV